jgi:hypothetical protein
MTETTKVLKAYTAAMTIQLDLQHCYERGEQMAKGLDHVSISYFEIVVTHNDLPY